ncbi:MAG TPA: hypothetical protein VN914_14150, partial [Polyangia bacterium]|nr:hypothetical protein [Polyangia bacterium]
MKRRVLILFGGRSAEHEISLLSARNVFLALDRARFDPVLVGIDKQGRWKIEPEQTLLEATGDPRLVAMKGAGAELAVPVRPSGPSGRGETPTLTLPRSAGEGTPAQIF